MTPPDEIELSVVMPCLDEAETVGVCIDKALRFLSDHGVAGEVIVADNGSTDDSVRIATERGARVVNVAEKGYGSAIAGGIKAARGRLIIMGDADDSYDFAALSPFLDRLRAGDELVVGNRFAGGIAPGAMPWLHRYVGNPVLSRLGRLFFGTPLGDLHCGLRGLTRDAAERLDLRTTGMEFASEMIVKATLLGLRASEVPATLSPDGRTRPPHLRTWRDGWRHLRFMLMYSPRWVFTYPGVMLMLVGAGLFAWLLPGARIVRGVELDVHSLMFASLALLAGYQAILFAVFTRTLALGEGLWPRGRSVFERLMARASLERGLLAGALVLGAGVALLVLAVHRWRVADFGGVYYRDMMRVVIPGVTLSVLGFQTLLASFFLSILQLRRR